jgi:hypothetical protein
VARRKQALVLKAPEWMPLETEIYYRAKASTGASELACADLQKALQNGRLRSASRHIVGDKDEPAPLAPSAWRKTFKLTEFKVPVLGGPHGAARAGALYRRPLTYGTERLHVVPRKERSFDGTWYFFGRRDDVDKLYPAATPIVDRANEAADKPPSFKPGPKPKGDWPTLVGAWLIRIALDEPHRLSVTDPNVTELAKSAITFLIQQIGWAPDDDSAVRRVIRHYLQLARP